MSTVAAEPVHLERGNRQLSAWLIDPIIDGASRRLTTIRPLGPKAFLSKTHVIFAEHNSIAEISAKLAELSAIFFGNPDSLDIRLFPADLSMHISRD